MKHHGIPKSYFERYSTLPVHLVPFDPKIVELGTRYRKKVEEILVHDHPDIEIGGAAALQMEGKGDLDINIYCTQKNWDSITETLSGLYGGKGTVMEEYVRYNDVYYATAVELIVTKGKVAYIQKSVLHYILVHPEVWEAYRRLKKEFCYSQREYNRQKNNFFDRIVDHLP